ncbi:DEAD-domain-containing protein [Gloeophyllum trabeum ATCC 11539]|uniref:ATP-dependent RNA helicase n=1 Tax=Gloeophyllum trabeum (strain ATCC 11539 / FP-39264 / Madison 617) TaxID=670483 RepID=S7RVN4_GLOTA|nr:DEAD-domain-containing protein [Gloeophyllum trabeum ATCC 11539]EPQ57329.1 DEAD-domain-containing protein [Gloeophyllum trabeum ATCC 11539]
MDDDLVLNLAVDDGATGRSKSAVKKGGRWTDRLKAKRGAKRKARPDEKTQGQPRTAADDGRPPPAKKARKEPAPNRDAAPAKADQSKSAPRQQTQFISSLFTSNPKVQVPKAEHASKGPSQPSNAPLDSSTFSGLGLDPLIVAHLTGKLKISRPTSIQKAALPALLGTANPSTLARDVFIQAQTGSGKTLAFLLPIIQDLLPLSALSWIDRSVGTLAVIIAPTRELAKQISDVLETLLKLRLRAEDEGEDSSSVRMTRWLVSGLLTGGSTRAHEKARLRKGVPILVSTPGRLLDHLQNTSSFNVGKCRWLVLDEADRLMELGFEETIKGIVKGLDGRRGLALQAVQEGKSLEAGGWDWERRRRTVLCSATIREDVQKLAGTTLANPLVVKPTESDLPAEEQLHASLDGIVSKSAEKFTPPSQLSQKYVVVPLKLRLVTLIALLRQLLSQAQKSRQCKIIVFLSCTDSVDFHWRLLGDAAMDEEEDPKPSSDDDSDKEDDNEVKDETNPHPKRATGGIEARSSLLPDTAIFRLHGSLPLPTRQASVRAFSAIKPSKSDVTNKKPHAPFSVLLCTSVASRGLDLPLVRAVVQYDLPTEGGATEYVHRVGRTARAGKGGEAWSFVAPSEVEWVKWVEGKMRGDQVSSEGEKDAVGLEGVEVDEVLKKGYGGKGREYEARATEVQLVFERWVLRRKENVELARRAFLSHMRAYATHPSDEKHIFHIRHLHIGHLAKSFALREAPSSVSGKKTSSKSAKSKSKGKGAAHNSPHTSKSRAGKGRPLPDSSDESDDEPAAERRMREAVRAQGRLSKKKGMLMSSGISEFQVTTGYDLEKLVQGAPS